MASREETLLFVVDVKVNNGRALAALDAEFAALDAAGSRHLGAVRSAALDAASGHRDLATAIDSASAAARRSQAGAAAVPNGNGSRSETAIWGARGPKNPGSKVNPIVFAKESGAAAGLGQLSADSAAIQTSTSPSTPTPPPPPPPSESNPTLVAAEAVARRIAASEDDRVVAAIRAAAQMRQNVGASPLLTAADAVRAAQTEPGMIEAIQLVQGARARRGGAAAPVLTSISAGEAARRLKLPISRVREMAATGALAGASKQGGQWSIPEQAVIDMMAAGGGSGPPIRPVLRPGGDSGGGNFWQRLIWGKGLFGLAGMGTLAGLGGLGAEHVLMTGVGLVGSAATAAAGAGLLGLGAAGQFAAGGGSDLLVGRAAYSNAKNAYTAYENLQTAVATYGKNSQQALQAQQQLNAALKDMPPQVAKASLTLAKQADALGTYFQKTTAKAQLTSDAIYKQVLDLARRYVPLVAQAAQHNLAVIDQQLHPLFAWLEGPHGIGIFQNLENNFAHALPYAMGAFRNGLELVLRVTSLASNYTGGFVKWLDHLFTRLNGFSDQKLNNVIGRLIGDFRLWKKFVKQIGLDLYYLFHNDAGTGQGIIQTLTVMLQKLGQWEKSTSGSRQLHNIFAVHKQEVIALLQLLEPLTRGFGAIYMSVAPAVTAAMTGILTAVTGVLDALVQLGPVARDALGALLISSKIFGFGQTVRGVTSFIQLLTGAQAKNTAVATADAAANARLAGALGAQDVAGVAGSGGSVGMGIGGGMLAGRLAGAAGVSAEGAPFVAAGLAPFLTGALAGGAGILGGGIVQHVTGLRGGTLPTLGGGLIGGGIGFALGGPIGAAIGAGVASTFAPTVVHLLGALFGGPSGVGYGKRFADGWMKSFEGIVTVRQGQQLRQQVKNATDQLNNLLNSHPRHRLGTRGEIVPLGPSGQQTAAAQYAYGVKIAHDFLQGIASVPYASTSGLIAAFDHQLAGLPKRAGAEGKAAAAETMLRFAAQLEQEGRLPRNAVAKILAGIEQQFPQLTSFLSQWDAKTSAQVEATFRLTQARRTLTDSLTSVRQDFVGASDVIAKQVTEQNLFPNLQRAMQFLKQQIATSTGQAKQEAIATFQQLQSQSEVYLDRLLGKTQATMLAVKGSAWTSFQSFASAVGAGMHAGAVDAATGAGDIAKALNTLLKSLGAPSLPLPSAIQWANWAVGNAPASSYSNAGSGIGHRFAGGFIDQPTIITGEESPLHPEFVLATNPAYRRRNVDLWLEAGHMLGIPGFARGGRISAPHARGTGAITGLVNAGLAHVTSIANAYLSAHMPSFAGGVSSAGLSGSLIQIVRQIAGRLGWGGQVQDWLNVIARESGGAMTARNRSSGAYGIAQFINGPGEYAQWGGNVGTMSGQLAAMANYIRSRYGSPSGAWAHELSAGWYARGGVARAVPLARLLGIPTFAGGGIHGGGGSPATSLAHLIAAITAQQNTGQSLANIDSLLMGVAPGASLHSLGLGQFAAHALGLSRHIIRMLMGNGAAAYGVEIHQLDRELAAYKEDERRLIDDYKRALKDHNKKLAHRILGELSQVDQAIATTSGNLGQAVANQIQGMQTKLDNRATGIGNSYSILQMIEGLPKGTNLKALGLTPKLLKSLGLGNAASLLGTAGTATGAAAENSLLDKEIAAYRRELAYDEKKLPHLHGAAKTSMEQAIQQLVQTILGLRGDINSNTAAVTSNTKATTTNTGAMTGSVTYQFQGQNYLASDTPMTAAMV